MARIYCDDSPFVALEQGVPTEVLILPYGTISTSQGSVEFTEASGVAVMAAWDKRNRDFGWDYEHQTFADPPVQAPASGWGKLALRADGLWCVGMGWTATAQGYLENREYRHFSPVLDLDGKTGEIYDIHNVALTNLPATHSQEPLVLSDKDQVSAPSGVSNGAPKVGSVALGDANPQAVVASWDQGHRNAVLRLLLTTSFDQRTRLVTEAIENHFSFYIYNAWLFDDNCVFSREGRYYQVPYTLNGTNVTLGALIEVERTFTPMPQPSGVLPAAILADKTSSQKLVDLLTQQAKQVEAEQVTKAEADKVKEVGAAKLKQVEAEKATLALSELRAEQLMLKFSNKISPAMRPNAKALALSDPALFESLMGTSPVLLPSGPPKPVTSDNQGAVALTETQRGVYKQLNITPKQLAEHRAMQVT